MGFQRSRVNERYKPLTRSKPKTGASILKRNLAVDEMIAHAICALGYKSVYSHHLQENIVAWIQLNYTMITPETVQREFRRMCNSGEHEIKKIREGRLTRFEIVRLFNLTINANQGTLDI